MNIRWRMKGPYFKNCNCDPGCPCDFWARPTHNFCDGMLAMRIDEGNFDDVPLAGLSFAGTYHFPGRCTKATGLSSRMLPYRPMPGSARRCSPS